MQLLLDVMQLVVHMRDLGAQAATIVILFPAPELLVDLPHLGLEMPAFLPDMLIGSVATHRISHMRHHSIQVFNFALELPQPIVPPIAPAVANLMVHVGVLDVPSRLVNGLLRFWIVLFLVFVRCHGQNRAGHAQKNDDGQFE